MAGSERLPVRKIQPMKLCRLVESRETLFIPKPFFSLVAAPWVLFSTPSGQYSWTFSWPAGSQAWNWHEVIKGAAQRLTAAKPFPSPLGMRLPPR